MGELANKIREDLDGDALIIVNAILDLHADDDGDCAHCVIPVDSEAGSIPYPWPCDTIQALCDALCVRYTAPVVDLT